MSVPDHMAVADAMTRRPPIAPLTREHVPTYRDKRAKPSGMSFSMAVRIILAFFAFNPLMALMWLETPWRQIWINRASSLMLAMAAHPE